MDHVWSISQDGRIIIWDVSEVEEGVRGRVTLKKLDGGHNGELRGALVVPGEEYPFVWFGFFFVCVFQKPFFKCMLSLTGLPRLMELLMPGTLKPNQLPKSFKSTSLSSLFVSLKLVFVLAQKVKWGVFLLQVFIFFFDVLFLFLVSYFFLLFSKLFYSVFFFFYRGG